MFIPIIMVKICAVVVRSGRVPIIFIIYVPGGFGLDTEIFPEFGSTLIRSVLATRSWPSELSTPLYDQVFPKEPQFIVAEKGVISKL